jgi:hypothetical protein
MGFEPMNTGFADLQRAFARSCTRLGPIVYSTNYRFHLQDIQAHLNRYPLQFPLQSDHQSFAGFILEELQPKWSGDLQLPEASRLAAWQRIAGVRWHSHAFPLPPCPSLRLKLPLLPPRVDPPVLAACSAALLRAENHRGFVFRKSGQDVNGVQSPVTLSPGHGGLVLVSAGLGCTQRT